MIQLDDVMEVIEHYAELIANHKKHGQFFNYEDFAKDNFAQRGRGYIQIDLTEVVVPFLSGTTQACEILHRYHDFNNQEKHEYEDKASNALVELLTIYNPNTQYVVNLLIDLENLPREVIHNIPNRYVFGIWVIAFGREESKVSRITPQQIRKRLSRMINDGVKLLIIDTSKPDFAGKNLEKWLNEIKKLERKGKYISVMIDSNSEESYQTLPDSLKANVLPIHFS